MHLRGLTPSQALFSSGTKVDVRSIQIKTDPEYFLFVQMRKEFQWLSYKMTPRRYTAETREYNTRLEALARKDRFEYIAKRPQALVSKLVEFEVKVLDRLFTSNYKCECYLEPFSLMLHSLIIIHCSARIR